MVILKSRNGQSQQILPTDSWAKFAAIDLLVGILKSRHSQSQQILPTDSCANFAAIDLNLTRNNQSQQVSPSDSSAGICCDWLVRVFCHETLNRSIGRREGCGKGRGRGRLWRTGGRVGWVGWGMGRGVSCEGWGWGGAGRREPGGRKEGARPVSIISKSLVAQTIEIGAFVVKVRDFPIISIIQTIEILEIGLISIISKIGDPNNLEN